MTRASWACLDVQGSQSFNSEIVAMSALWRQEQNQGYVEGKEASHELFAIPRA